MPFTPAERKQLIDQYATGPTRLRAALRALPPEVLQWRPGPGTWSAHEIACHCADTETVAATRIRFVLVEKSPVIVGFDQDAWTAQLGYHDQPLAPALAVVDAVRSFTTTLLRQVAPDAWRREGRHTEAGLYTAEDWLRVYARHLDDHARQIEANHIAWRARAHRGSPSR